MKDSEDILCPWCGEPGYDLEGLKSHVSKGECQAFEETPTIRSPFDYRLAEQ